MRSPPPTVNRAILHLRRPRNRWAVVPAGLAVGQLVHAQWTNGTFYPARIVKAQGGLYEVAWEDGSAPSWVRGDQIQGDIPRLATSTPEHVIGAPDEKIRLRS